MSVQWVFYASAVLVPEKHPRVIFHEKSSKIPPDIPLPGSNKGKSQESASSIILIQRSVVKSELSPVGGAGVTVKWSVLRRVPPKQEVRIPVPFLSWNFFSY